MSNKLTLETLSALCEAEPGFVSRSAKALGVSVSEMRSLTAEGKVDMFTLAEKLASKGREAADENKALKARVAELESLSVTNILIDITPGEDGMGHEIYATSVDQVVNKMSDLGSRLEDYQLGIAAPPQGQADAREFPAMTPELASILGLMCFQCIPFAQALRTAGHQINARAEDEQAAVLHWMLGHWFRHGEEWRDHAQADMNRMKDAAIAAAKGE